MQTYRISKNDRHIKGHIRLDGSKSISNRVLIIRSLCSEDFAIHGLSTSNDTTSLLQLLKHPPADGIYDTGAAGTTFRFLTAYLSLQAGTHILTGSNRMKQRPIGVLVKAMSTIGANIEYIDKEGYPPLRIHPPVSNEQNRITISASVSSQFISALLLIAPTLPNGLILELDGKIVSRPYIEMTLSLMHYFGAAASWEGQQIIIPQQQYKARTFQVEADWSAASYYYALASFSDKLDLRLDGLFKDSLQGDAVIEKLMQWFGIKTSFYAHGIHLTKVLATHSLFRYNFIKCPDIAQTMAVICAGHGIEGYFSGLETLRIKETDRITALKIELQKIGVTFNALPNDDDPNKTWFCTKGKAKLKKPVFDTYEDHRMAMAFAPLALFGTINVHDPAVVSKSYPDFWQHLQLLGFLIDEA